MRYCTAELYSKQNDFEENEESLNAAMVEWEKALEGYEKRIHEIKSHLPESVLKFMDVITHDADFIKFENVDGKFYLNLHQHDWGEEYHCRLEYKLRTPDVINVVKHKMVGFHSAEPPQLDTWIYDEWDMIEPGVFEHNIILSDGTEVNIHFTEFNFVMSK